MGFFSLRSRKDKLEAKKGTRKVPLREVRRGVRWEYHELKIFFCLKPKTNVVSASNAREVNVVHFSPDVSDSPPSNQVHQDVTRNSHKNCRRLWALVWDRQTDRGALRADDPPRTCSHISTSAKQRTTHWQTTFHPHLHSKPFSHFQL